eukprot:3652_1
MAALNGVEKISNTATQNNWPYVEYYLQIPRDLASMIKAVNDSIENPIKVCHYNACIQRFVTRDWKSVTDDNRQSILDETSKCPDYNTLDILRTGMSSRTRANNKIITKFSQILFGILFESNTMENGTWDDPVFRPVDVSSLKANFDDAKVILDAAKAGSTYPSPPLTTEHFKLLWEKYKFAKPPQTAEASWQSTAYDEFISAFDRAQAELRTRYPETAVDESPEEDTEYI